jgi:thiosulfate/3-mercaptopyruvate sulfurtransferase
MEGKLTKPKRVRAERPVLWGPVAAQVIVLAMAWMLGPFPALSAAERGASREPWKSTDLIEPRDLNATLSGSVTARPLIVYVGFDFLYDSAHIPGALYFGPGRTPQGVAALTRWVRKVPPGRLVVIYCGCCPWDECPNIRPAFKALRDAGVKNLKLLHIPHSLLRDWINASYPVEKGR